MDYMAGVMLKTIKSCGPGYYITVGVFSVVSWQSILCMRRHRPKSAT
jgi:hypothetical protein